MDDTPPRTANRKRAACPICGKAPDAAFTPFCSRRCANVDLHRWLAGVYVAPTDEPPDAEEA